MSYPTEYGMPVETPPELPEDDHGGGGDEGGAVAVSITIQTADGTIQQVGWQSDADDPVTISDCLFRAVAGIAAGRGHEFQLELAKRWMEG